VRTFAAVRCKNAVIVWSPHWIPVSRRQLHLSAVEPDSTAPKLLASGRAGHTQASIKALLPRLHYFKEGTCIVHHMFGGEVTELVSKAYGDAYLTAHFEVSSSLRVLQETAWQHWEAIKPHKQ
jgi:hypothetical protein